MDGRRGINIYEVSLWLWQFGCGKPHLGGLSAEATEEKMQAHRQDSQKCGARLVGCSRQIANDSKQTRGLTMNLNSAYTMHILVYNSISN